MDDHPSRLRLPDFLLIALYAFVLFAYSGISGRPLTMHEARLPETSREMRVSHNWLLPQSGIRPWLERPPLPHWIVVASMKVFHHDDQVWVVRLPSAIMGLITVLLVAGISGKWFGRNIGLLSGLILASSYEFCLYSGMAEDDIYLGSLVAISIAFFVAADFSPSANESIGFFKNRRWTVWGFFIVLGLTNLTKGPLLGLAVVGVTVGPYLLWRVIDEQNWRPLRRFLWFWGGLILLVLTIAWPLWAYHKYPDVLANWKYDYLGRMNGSYDDITERWYYYGPELARCLLPWTPAAIIGLLATAKATFRRVVPDSNGVATIDPTLRRGLRLVWCWAILPVILFSIPKGKHHHYLIPFLAPWAILCAFGAVEIGKWILAPRGPGWLRDPVVGMLVLGFPGAIAVAWFHEQIPGPQRLTLLLLVLWVSLILTFFLSLKRSSARLMMTTILMALLVGYCWGETFLAAPTDHTVDDTAFLMRVRSELPANRHLYINANLQASGNLDFFRIQFYSPPGAILLHNLSYLRDENIHEPEVFVIARAKDLQSLAQLGTASIVDQSALSHERPKGWTDAEARFTLFKLDFDPNLKRYPAPTRITSMQAMERDHKETGPWCGPPLGVE